MFQIFRFIDRIVVNISSFDWRDICFISNNVCPAPFGVIISAERITKLKKICRKSSLELIILSAVGS